MKTKIKIRLGMIVCFLLAIGAYTGCGKKETGEPRPHEGQQLGQMRPNEVVALVDGRKIRRSQLDSLAHYYSRNLLHRGHQPPPDFEESVLDRLIESEILYQIGRKMDVPDLSRRVEEEYNNFISRYPSGQALAEDMARNDATVDGLRESLKKEIIVSFVLDREVYDKVTVSEEEIEEYYRDQLDRLEKPERIKVRQILVSVPKLATVEQKEAARKKAEGLKERWEAGEDFGALAREHSDDKESAPRDGTLGSKRKGEWLPALEEAAWDLEPGSLSEPVETRFGYHLVLLDEKLPAGLPPLDEVRDEITAALKARKTPEMIKRLIDDFKEKFKVEKIWKREE